MNSFVPMPLAVRLLAAITGVALTVLGGCYEPAPVSGLPCSEQAQCPSGQMCLSVGVCVVERGAHQLLHDSAADFAQPGAALVDAVILDGGTVEAQPWLTHGLLMSATSRAGFTDATAASWAALESSRVAERAVAYSTVQSWGMNGAPAGLGLGRGTDITLLLEGEIFLSAGAWRLELRGDDSAFVELASPGATEYRRVLVHGGNGSALITEQVPADGWYPVRMATANLNLGGSLQLRGALGAGPLASFDVSRLRTRLPQSLRGLVQESFDSQGLVRLASAKLTPSLRDVSFGTGTPPDSNVASATQFSVRYSGQFLVEGSLDGFTLTSEGGHRVWIDGALQADKMTGSATSALSGLGLGAGWHDLVIDLNKRAAGASSLRITAPVGDPTAFTDAKLRPVLGVGQRVLTTRNGAVDVLPDPPDSVSRTLTLAGIPGTALATAVEFAVDHSAHAELSLALSRGATQRTLAAQGSLTGSGFGRFRFELDPRMYPTSPGGTWTLTAADNLAATGTGNLESAAVTTLYRATSAASAPFAQAFTYTSALQDLGDVVYLGKASWQVLRGEGQDVTVSVRTGATEDACLSADWQVVAADGTSPAPALRFLQYRFQVKSPTVAVAVDRFQLDYYGKQ